VYVARDYSAAAQLAGAEVLSINNVPIARILASMLAVSHGDGDSPTAGPYQLSHGRGFARSLYMIVGLRSPFRIRYISGGKTAEASLTGMPPKVLHEVELSRYPSPPQQGNATWRLLEGGSIGVLKIASFDGNAEDGMPMSAFFERVFTEAHNGNVSKLIVDVRDNGGGEDELGRVLFSYFAERPFRYYRDLIVNNLSFRFFQYVPGREPLPPSVHEMVKPGADGKYHVVGHPNWGMQQPAAPHFGGKVVVLMNGGSFSTTCEFLSTLHHQGGATFVGEETAGGYYGNTSGAAASMVLPNSKLILPVQLVGYYLAIEGDALGAHGIRPDHHVEHSIDDVLAGRDRAMEMALRLASEAPGGR
jgi:C-terminal processing protease CtpA/Prc